MAEYFKYSLDYLLDRTYIKEYQNQYSEKIVHLIDMGELISIYKVSAGTGNTIISCDKVVKLYPVTPISPNSTYASIITGDSIEPRFYDNDIIYVNGNEIPIDGDIGVFTYISDSYCKRYYAKDGMEKLVSLNAAYNPILESIYTYRWHTY